MRRLACGPLLGGLLVTILLSACGGGGGYGNGYYGGGGGSITPVYGGPGSTVGVGNGSVSSTYSGAANQVQVTVEQNPDINGYATLNMPYVTVKVCDTQNHCVTIPRVIVDTGSVGLRVLQSAVTGLTLTPQIVGTNVLAECAQFLSSYTWGGVYNAQVSVGGETTTQTIPIQVMEDSNLPTAPTACASVGTDSGTLQGMGGNGLLGIGFTLQDSGPYYSCTTGLGGSCTALNQVALASELANPAGAFPVDNNGVILTMPSVGSGGQTSATGVLTFGIGTQANNSIAGFSLLPTDINGYFTVNLAGQGTNNPYQQSFLDSGSNLYFFNLNGVPTDSSGNYIPAAPLTLSATLTSTAVPATPALNYTLDIADGTSAVNNGNTALNNVAAPGYGAGADLGFPFFYGHSVGLVFSGKTAGSVVGPQNAIQ